MNSLTMKTQENIDFLGKDLLKNPTILQKD